MKIIHFGVMTMVSLVMIAGLMVPITSEFADEIHSVDFNENTRYSLAEADHRVEAKIENGMGYINNELVYDDYNSRMMMFSDSFVLQYNPTAIPHTFNIFTESTNTVTVTNLVAEKGTWTATTSANNTIQGTYEFLMAWNKNGNYGAIPAASNVEAYVNSDAKVYVCVASVTNNSALLKSGQINNLKEVLNYNITEDDSTITTEQFTTTPNVLKITSFTSTVTPAALFIPLKYDEITGMDNMLKTIVALSPLFVGIMLFAAMGVSLMRLGKLE